MHNLHTYAWGDHGIKTFDWAMRFEQKVRELIVNGHEAQVVDYGKLGPDTMLSVPTPDHYLPFLYLLGLRRKHETISFPAQGVDGGSVSILAVQIG